MSAAGAIRAGATFVEVYAKDHKLVSSLKSIKGKMKSFGDSLTNIGTKMFAGGSAMLTPLLGAAQQFASMGDVFSKMSDRTGASVESLSELAYAAQQSGASVEDLEKGMRKAQQNMTDAAAGSKTAQEAFAAIGLSAKDLADLSPDEQFKLIAEAISRISDPAARTTAAMDVLGKSGSSLMPMMLNGAKGIEELQQSARNLGLTMRGSDAKAATALGDAWDDLWKVLRMGIFVVGSALAPVLMEATKFITDIAVQTKAWVEENKPLVVVAFKVAAAIAAAGAAFIAIGTAVAGFGVVMGGIASIISGVGTVIGIMGAALAALVSPIGLALTAMVALGTYFFAFTETGGEAIDWLLGKFNSLKDGCLKVFAGISNALAAGNIGLAADVMWKTLKLAWQKGVNWLTEIWVGFKRSFMEVATGMWYGAQAALVMAWSGLQKTWIEVTSFLSTTWSLFTSSIQIAWSSVSDTISKGMLDLYKVWDDHFGSGTFDVELAKSFVDSAGEAQRSKIATDSQAAINQTEKDKQKRLAGVTNEENAALSDIGNKDAEARRQRESEYAKQIQQSQKELEDATKAWNDSLNQAASEAEAAKSKAPGAPDKPKFLDSSTTDRIGAAGSAGIKGEAKGGFAYNSYGLQGLSAGSAVERTAKAAEEMVKQQKITNRKLDNNSDDGSVVAD